MALTEDQINGLLRKYFKSCRQYKAILCRLKHVHHVNRSMSWLKRRFRALCLKRRVPDSPESTIRAVIEDLLKSSNQLRGYRSIWRILNEKYSLNVRRDTVMKMLREMDQEGVKQRGKRRLKRRVYRSKGPNYVWHADGYDKLSAYGLCIHGCIDGFSRKILWMEVAPTNHNPKVVAGYFLTCVEKCGGCPTLLRCDYGTENVNLAAIQIAFRMNHEDSQAAEKSFIYGPSTANIRIESWWSQLRRFKTHWWIDLCKSLVSEGHFQSSNTVHKWTLAFTLCDLLRNELNDFVSNWNCHRIRQSRADVLGGIPEDLYDMPDNYGASNYLKPVDRRLWTQAKASEAVDVPRFYPDWFYQLCITILDESWGMDITNITPDNCKQVYIHLIEFIQ